MILSQFTCGLLRDEPREICCKQITDGIVPPERVWVSYVLDFVTTDECLILQVLAEKDRAAFAAGVGYAMSDLEASLATTDPRLFRKFRQNLCTGPIAKRLLSLYKLQPVKADVKKPVHDKADVKKPFEKKSKLLKTRHRRKLMRNRKLL